VAVLGLAVPIVGVVLIGVARAVGRDGNPGVLRPRSLVAAL
jgi:hypothetical protein